MLLFLEISNNAFKFVKVNLQQNKKNYLGRLQSQLFMF